MSKIIKTPLLSPKEVKEQSRKAIERVIAKLIAKEFRLDLRAIGEAVKHETTEFDYLMIGLQQTYTLLNHFRYHKTLFRQCAPADISKSGWTVLKHAMRELSNVFHVRAGPNDSTAQKDQRPTYRLKWLAFNLYNRCPVILGLYGEEYVVAAANALHTRAPFVPFNFYQIFHQNPAWKNLKYQAGYRHFQAQFDIGYSFYTEQQHLPCVITYGGQHRSTRSRLYLGSDRYRRDITSCPISSSFEIRPF